MHIATWDRQRTRDLLINDPIPTAIGLDFNRNGRRWRVSALCDTFVIGTAIDAVLDNHGGPSRSSDIIKVTI